MAVRLTHEFVEEEYRKADIILLSQYVNSKFKNKLQCIECNHIWFAMYNSLQNLNQGCPECNHQSYAHTHEFIEKEYKKNNIILLTQYINGSTKNKLRCIECNHIWASMYITLRKNAGCPECNSQGGKQELLWKGKLEEFFGCEFIKVRCSGENNIPLIRFPKTNYPAELDGYNDELKIAFEYQGIQHYEEGEKIPFHTKETILETQKRDVYKVQRCEELGIKLIIIPYYTKDISTLQL